MISKLLVFGATGDLTGRFLLPALAALRAAGKLHADFQIVGSAREDWDDERFQRYAADQLAEHASEVDCPTREALVRSLRYAPVDFKAGGGVRRVVERFGLAEGPLAAYLALPAQVFATAVSALASAGLPEGSRIVLEKPFGDDLESAIALNALLRRLYGSSEDEAIFRVDHALGMATVQNLVTLRLANPAFESIWSCRHIESIRIHWEETLALEGRASHFDRAGTLKDVVQNHMLQLLCLVAMEPPGDAGALRDRKLAVLKAAERLNTEDVRARTRRARYTAGVLAGPPEGSGERVPDYADEDGVDPERGTETFAQLTLAIDMPRWRGTPFVLRAGKALGHRRKGVVIRFKPAVSPAFARSASQLLVGIDGPDTVSYVLEGGTAGPSGQLEPLQLTSAPVESDLPAYGHVLLDVLGGGSALSIGGDEAEEAWRVVSPVLSAWAANEVPLEEYPAGSDGPASGKSSER